MFIVAMHRHDRENRADFLKLAKGAVLGMLCGVLAVGFAVLLLIAYFKSA